MPVKVEYSNHFMEKSAPGMFYAVKRLQDMPASPGRRAGMKAEADEALEQTCRAIEPKE